MGLSEIPADYMSQNAGLGGHVVVMEHHKDKISNKKKKMHILKKIKKLVRRSPSSSSCPGPNNLPPLQFHSVHGDNIRISRDGTLARRFESFCRAITFSARPVRINERICVKFAEISNNWNGGIRFGFTSNDPVTLEGGLPKYACPDLTNRPGFWAKALHEQYCEKDNILYYYVNTAGDVIYGINNEEKGVILSGIDTRTLLWTIIDIYGNCTGIEFLDSRIYMYQQGSGGGGGGNSGTMTLSTQGPQVAGGVGGTGSSLSSHHPHQQSRRSLPASGVGSVDPSDLERHLMPSMQSLNIAAAADHAAIAADLANGLPPLRYNANGRLIPVPFHLTKGRNVRLSHDRFIASRTESDFCQGYVFTARPIRIGEKVIVQILKTEQMYVGALALGLTSCNPATLQPSDLPNDSDFLLDRPEYWVVSKDIASTPQRGDEIAFFVAPNGEVTISKNNGPAVVVMHVDQSLQLWAFLDVYGSTQSVRMFRQQLPNMVAAYPQQMAAAAAAASSRHLLPVSESMNSLNSQISEARKMTTASSSQLHPSQLNVTHSSLGTSSSTLASMQSSNNINSIGGGGGGGCAASNLNGCGASVVTHHHQQQQQQHQHNQQQQQQQLHHQQSYSNANTATTGRLISMPSNGDMIQIQPNGGGTVLVVNLPPASSTSSLHNSNELNGVLSVSQARINQTTGASGVLAGACSSGGNGGASSQLTEPNSSMANGNNLNRWKDTVDHHNAGTNSTDGECIICSENQIDSVLYMCGHMCMCYDCAIEQWRGAGAGQCPMCRAVIRDVIRTYTT